MNELKSGHFESLSSTPKTSARREQDVEDLKTSLNDAIAYRESSQQDFFRRPPRGHRYDPRRNTTGLTEYEIRLNQTSK